jgi:indolepyruvate ferredoxin oxidoreductase
MAQEHFDNIGHMSYHLAPPLLSKIGSDGRPKKRRFGAIMDRGFTVLSKLKMLRGTPLDIFGYSFERKMERDLIRQYEGDIAKVLPMFSPETKDKIIALAELPMTIRGFGPVKLLNEQKAAKRREELLEALYNPKETLNHAAE